MGKRKRKKRRSFGDNLKYEVYGILLITISVIALSGEATVGRSLSKLFGLVLGKFYFVLALVGVYAGLSVMVKRQWPSGWSNRKSGLLLLVLAFTLMSSMSEVSRKLEPSVELTASAIMEQLGSDIRGALLTSDASGGGLATQQSISGGYAGAVQYALLYSLFGYFGAKFILIVMFAIAIMLITGRSYVDLARVVQRRLHNLIKLIHAKAASRPVKRTAPKTSGLTALQPDDMVDHYDDADDDFGGTLQPARQNKKSLFFSWRSKEAEQTAQPAGDDDWMMEEPFSSGGASPVSPEVTISSRQSDDDVDVPPWQTRADDQPDKRAGQASSEGSKAGAAVAEYERPATAENDELEDDNDDWTEDLAEVHPEGIDDGELDELPAGSESAAFDSPALEGAAPAAGSGSAAAAPQIPEAKPYRLPPLSLLAKPSGSRGGDSGDSSESRRKLEATLESFGVRAKVLDVVRGPAVTRYEVQPATGVKVSRIVGLTDDIALALAAKDIRMEAPIPGKSAIGIEVPNSEVSVVTMREVMETPTFTSAPSKLSIAFGRDISGQTIVGNLARMPHLLVAGATGSGKSVCINGIITSILYKAAPDEVKFMMIDPKMVELNVYNGIPHLLAPVVTDPRRASLALKKIVVEMEKRYELFSKSATRNIEGYNGLMKDNPAAVLPYIVVIVDELADLMMVAANDVEEAITRLAQMARAAGIHLIIATQRPSVDVITGVIKANIPSRIAFGVSSQVDSRTILDMVGAEKLLGRGDMLFLPVGMSKPIRVQGAFLSDQEVEAVVEFARGQAEAEYKEDLVPEIEEPSGDDNELLDELFDQAVQIVLEAKQASVSLLQRRMRVGYTRAARLVDQMEAKGIVGPYEGSKPREVLLSLDQYQANQKHA
ncbi:FtsK/SpoIIIE family DNA translocase [Paenibacillus beijingensis]|uniref:Cell division protein FtsK n=1 Tax=Paenibacillus beijingensis TaxID=1126833 RepID=A0A0D5NMV2_9BACL|nr:DNA translocase FtsK [Paenibacillus beijingensis]AJY76624.1 cell division protein FtsK [Paenibacillus beijingensis]